MAERSGRLDEDLAYGEEWNTSRGRDEQEGNRGLIGDTFRKLRGRYDQYAQQGQYQQQGQPSAQASQGSSSYSGGQYGSQPQYGAPLVQGNTAPYSQQAQSPYGSSSQQKPDIVSKLFDGLHGTIQSIGSDVAGILGGQYQPQPYGQYGYSASAQGNANNRYGSFASEKIGNDMKWYVDGAGYMWAVSRALEGARESIWILDWWLSPELYLRRPPSSNERYRLDRMLLQAAQRGVRVNIIVYKEVTQVLTRKTGSDISDYLHSFLPSSTDAATSTLVRAGLHATTASLSHVERVYPLITPPITVSSSHTKHALENLHPNIAVFRHPDHLPDPTTIQSSLNSSFQNLKLNAAGVSKFGTDQLNNMFGRGRDGNVLFWAHHEKLCVVDRKLAFFGGLDLCLGRWDTNQHPLSDVHANIASTVFPGQDYNNARILDFNDVAQPFQNKLDRTRSSRMGWSDVSCSVQGNVVPDLLKHFVDRWNFIFDEKYNIRKDARYSRLSVVPSSNVQQSYSEQTQPAGGYNASPQQGNLQPPQQILQNPSLQFPPPPGSQPSPQSSWQSTSRPHTPQAAYENPQNSYQSWQISGGPSSPQPPAYQQATSMQYPPPPPGGPPQMSASKPVQYETNFPASSQGYSGSSYPHVPNVPELDSNAASYSNNPVQATRGLDDQPYYEHGGEGERGFHEQVDKYRNEGLRLGNELKNVGNMVSTHAETRIQNIQGKLFGGTDRYGRPLAKLTPGNVSCQLVRSCTTWSNGTITEHSIQDAYIDVIRKSQHFIYIENQFFITTTSQNTTFGNPVKNQIGRAIVDRILQAARNGEYYKVIVLVPSVPGFAGDLRDDSSLGTRAIMELQYDSIARGENSIFEMIAKEGYNPQDYIRFYNLRNYDRINMTRTVRQVEQQSGVHYEDARKQHDDIVGAGFGGYGEGTGASSNVAGPQYQQYEKVALNTAVGSSGRWDTVSECYMLGGTDIRNVPWEGDPEAEIDAFVSEELYIHSKVLIADDRVVICGSANLNDRSQLGTHDSEIAVVISDPTPVHSSMAGQPWQASRFAASLRRQLFRKHLGLITCQDMTRPEAVDYDWDTPEDRIVADPLSDTFHSLWNSRARQNTDIFRKVFRCVPDDNVQTWGEYKEFFEYFFQGADAAAEGRPENKTPPRYEWGHIVREDFPPGPEGIRQVKELLSQVKGTLVEMPLMFLANEDIATEGLKLNPLTVEVYT